MGNRPLDLEALGEFGLIGAVRARAEKARAGRREWAVGIGDDAAILRPRPGRDVVVAVDALVEDVHFRWSTTLARALGGKSLAVNLSDLAAMGATPLGCLLTLGLPDGSDPSRIDGFFAGLLAAAGRAGCPLVGGDTVRAGEWTISVTAFGEVARGRALLRSGARAGDRIFVTGDLGGSALGLALLERGRREIAGAEPFVRRHLRPKPRLEAGAALARGRIASAAIDVSDGFLSDLGHILEESGVGATIDSRRLPLPRGASRIAGALDLDPVTLALTGGEDYELVFCVRERRHTARALRAALGCRITEVGVVERSPGLRDHDGSSATRVDSGFDHFKAKRPRSDKS